MRVAVAGGTGQVGRPTIAALKLKGHDAIGLSRSAGVDLMTSDGLAAALEGRGDRRGFRAEDVQQPVCR